VFFDFIHAAPASIIAVGLLVLKTSCKRLFVALGFDYQ
jgi:hypothetical protein